MMRPVSLAMPPLKATWPATGAVTLTGTSPNQRVSLTWNDNSITETRFVVKRSTDGTTWTTVGTRDQPLGNTNLHGQRTFTDITSSATTPYMYRILAENTVGHGSGMPSMRVRSTSDPIGANVPTAPTGLTAALAGSPLRVALTWNDTATNETGFVIQRSTNNGATFTDLISVPAKTGTGAVTYADTTVATPNTYVYRVAAQSGLGPQAWSNTATIKVDKPAKPVLPQSRSVPGPAR